MSLKWVPAITCDICDRKLEPSHADDTEATALRNAYNLGWHRTQNPNNKHEDWDLCPHCSYYHRLKPIAAPQKKDSKKTL